MDDKEKDLKRERRARLISIAVMMYILGVTVLVFAAIVGDNTGHGDLGGEIGVILMLFLAAVATGLIVYANMSTPMNKSNYSSTNIKKIESDLNNNTSENNFIENDIKSSIINNDEDNISTFKSIIKLYWLVVTIIYLAVSFWTRAWYITWLIWLIGAAVEQGIRILHSINKK